MKLQFPFIQLPLSFDAAVLAAEVGAIPESSWRPHPQGYPGNSALTLISAGGDPDSDAARGPMRPTEYLRACPYLQQVLHGIGATWGRTRLMRLSGQAEVSPHVDTNYYWRERVRVHVPIVTQPSVRFVCGDAEINMAAGECWIFDTWRRHNVINDHIAARIHLVADTVGGSEFWDAVAAGRPHGQQMFGWNTRRIGPSNSVAPTLDFESVNAPAVMNPWEIKEHIGFLIAECQPHPGLAKVQILSVRFLRRWHSVWSAFGEAPAGWPRYRELLEGFAADMTQSGAAQIALRNQCNLLQVLQSIVFAMALADRGNNASVSGPGV